jgi:hypothetical protein
MMQVVYTHCAGLDVHKKTLVACARIVQDDGTRTSHIHTFPTTTTGLVLLVDWLLGLSITHVAMDSTALADLAQGRLRAKRAELEQALRGTLQAHHAFMITQHLAHLAFLEEQIAVFGTQIEAMIQASGLPPAAPLTPKGAGSSDPVAEPAPTKETSQWVAARTICDAVPGIGPRVAETIVAELGTDMSRFPSTAHAASWAGLAPGQNESAGKRRAVRIGKGNGFLKSALIQASWAAIKVKDSFLAAFYRRVATRRGNKKAIVAVAHKILVIVYTLLKTGEPYQEPGVPVPDEWQKARLIERMLRRIAQLGYKVNLEPIGVAAS